MRLFFRLAAATALLLLLLLLPGPPAPAAAPGLDLSKFRMTFDDAFKTMDISAHGPGSVWIAHTPWNGDFGNDVFGDPGPGGPFSITPEGLAITATRNAQGRWQGGLISSRDGPGPAAHGFAQQYGYFEISAKLPAGAGVWPAFWLVGTDTSKGTSEIDVLEYYGHADDEYHITEHFWVNGKDRLGAWHVVPVPPGSLTSGFNRYGVWIAPDRIRYYFNRQLVWSSPTPPEYNQPFYILANFAIGGGWPYGSLRPPLTMDIRYIRAFQRIGQ